ISTHSSAATTGKLTHTLGPTHAHTSIAGQTRRKVAHEQLVEVVEGELDSRRGVPGQARRVLLRPDLPVPPAAARPVPGANGCTAGAAARRDRDRGTEPRRSGEVRRVPALARPRPPEVSRESRALRRGPRRAARSAADVRR